MKNRFQIRGDVTAIFLKHRDGRIIEALIDTSDLPCVQSFCGTWGTAFNRPAQKTYVIGHVGQKKISLHRFLTDFPSGMEVDHTSHDGLDNRRQSLLVRTHAMNILNRRGPRKGSKSGLRGVIWYKRGKCWHARVMVAGKTHCFGYFKDKLAASARVQEFLATIPHIKER